MVDVPKPRQFKKFAEWLDAVTEGGTRSQADVARVTGVKRQMVTKWLDKSKPKPAHLSKLATDLGVEYEELRALVDGIPPTHPPGPRSFHGFTMSREAAELGAEWEKITDQDLRTAVFNLIEVAVAAQKRMERRHTNAEKQTKKKSPENRQPLS